MRARISRIPEPLARIAPGLDALLSARPGDLRHDVTAGLSVAAVAVPVGVAYAQLAGFEPQVGLYASVLPLVAYALFGTSRQLIVGPDAATCAMVAAAVAPLAAGNAELYASLTVVLTFVAGLFCIGGSFLKLGALADFLSRPILVGYLAGVALVIVFGQVGKVTGLDIEASGITPRLLEVLRELPLVHLPTFAVALAAFAVLMLSPAILPRVPAALVALIALSIIVALFGLEQRGVAVVGEIPAGFPTLHLPTVPVDMLGALIAQAAAVALVSFTSGIVTARAFAAKNRYEIDVDREFAALGAAQIAAAVSQGFPVAGADSRTAMNDAAGGRTQVASLVAAATIAFVILFLTGPIRYAPTAALGAVLIKSAMSLFDVRAFREILQIDRREFFLAILTTLGVVWLGAINAVLLAVLLALLRFVRAVSRPNLEVLGAQEGVRGHHDLRHYPGAQTPAGIILLRFTGPLTFFNAGYFRERVLAQVAAAGPDLRAVILDATGFSAKEDATAVLTLVEMHEQLAAGGVTLALAGKRHLIEEWRRSRGLCDEGREGRNRLPLFSTVEDAIEAFSSGRVGDCE